MAREVEIILIQQQREDIYDGHNLMSILTLVENSFERDMQKYRPHGVQMNG